MRDNHFGCKIAEVGGIDRVRGVFASRILRRAEI